MTLIRNYICTCRCNWFAWLAAKVERLYVPGTSGRPAGLCASTALTCRASLSTSSVFILASFILMTAIPPRTCYLSLSNHCIEQTLSQKLEDMSSTIHKYAPSIQIYPIVPRVACSRPFRRHCCSTAAKARLVCTTL
jgi:hypothetical protein